MTLEIFLLGLMIVSIFTGLFSGRRRGCSAVHPGRRRVPDSDGDADQRQDGRIFNCTCTVVLACFHGGL